jgi:hypothetical protein
MKPTILIQLDTDPQPSTFDSVVAIDSGVDRLLTAGGVRAQSVRELVHGAMFTRGGSDLSRTAIFLGGSDIALCDELQKAVTNCFFGPVRVSVMADPSGANSTAAAVVLSVIQSLEGALRGSLATVLAGTGPVGQRVVRLLAREGAGVRLGSRQLERATTAAKQIAALTGSEITPVATSDENLLAAALEGAHVVIAAGAGGVCLLPMRVRRSIPTLKVALDVNAVPPAGIEGIEATDTGSERDGVKAWGALGVGGLKMKIHKYAIHELFTRNDLVLDAEPLLALGKTLIA